MAIGHFQFEAIQAKEFLKILFIRSIGHFKQLYQQGIIPKHIPKNPYVYYKKNGDWVGYSDFLSHF
jgi:hypothetical protein